MSLEAGRGLSISDLLRLLNEKLGPRMYPGTRDPPLSRNSRRLSGIRGEYMYQIPRDVTTGSNSRELNRSIASKPEHTMF